MPEPAPRIHVQNFGCRATQADGAALEQLLSSQGFDCSGGMPGADLVILNTCTVTSEADQDVRKAIHRVTRGNPGARILVTGCYAQRAPEELSRIPGVTWVVGNSHKSAIPRLLGEGLLEGVAPFHGQVLVGDVRSGEALLSSPVSDASGDRTRPNLKIQDGCDNPCTFCIIPAVRGRSRSMAVEEVLGHVRRLAESYREIVLTGINLGRWGRESGFTWRGERVRLAGMVRMLLDETPVERLRLSSVEPMDLSDELLEAMAGSTRIARHVHAPLQSGSDAVLKRMKRRYRARHYEDRLRQAAALMPGAAFGADVMTGFPGETEEEFQETFRFVERMPFTYLHVFTYSERPGTPAAEAGDHVPHQVRKRRTRELRELAARKNLEFRRAHCGLTLSAVTLDNGKALTSNYLNVTLASPREANRLVDLRIGGVSPDGLLEAGALPVL
jgi:threonylcarbamoyladenosine tRNA methylthiotransferase MtaB